MGVYIEALRKPNWVYHYISTFELLVRRILLLANEGMAFRAADVAPLVIVGAVLEQHTVLVTADVVWLPDVPVCVVEVDRPGAGGPEELAFRFYILSTRPETICASLLKGYV